MRGKVSIILMLFFVFVACSGVMIHPAHNISAVSLVPSNHDNFILKRLHEWAGYTLIILGVVHLLFNRKAMLRYIGWKKVG